ncbi:hypothetical protein [Streptomyces sp. NPDC050738]|uniref:hypothetical protein n=1 Tax=Streptomyces sp. NPDC050738 TaxID=3154744 RepID=UPI00342235DF
MPDLPNFHSATINAIVDHVGRATLPFHRAHQDDRHATAFWFNELVETVGDGEVVRQYLVTAGEPARAEIAEFTLRAALCSPQMSAQKLMMVDFAEGWTHLDGLGVAVMSTVGLHAHGERKGWSWTTDEVTDGITATEEDVDGLGEGPVAAYLLGHVTDEGTTDREQAVVVGEVVRDGSGVRWAGKLPQGCVGAPVFIGAGLGGQSFKLVCIGVALPGGDHHPIATFDRIRTALRALAPDVAAAPQTIGQKPPSGAPKRRWWRRSR